MASDASASYTITDHLRMLMGLEFPQPERAARGVEVIDQRRTVGLQLLDRLRG